MNKRIISLCILFITTSVFCIDFPGEFQKALKDYKQLFYYNKGNAVELENRFLKLAKEKIKPFSKDECFVYAAYCAMYRKDYPKAIEYIDKIKEKHLQKLCRMKLNWAQGKKTSILELSQEDDLTSWPDRLIYDAAMYRGRAHIAQNNLDIAKKDFILAKNSTLDHGDIIRSCYALITIYHRTDEEKKRQIEDEVTRIRCSDATRAAELFSRLSRFKTALKNLDKLNVDSIRLPDCRSAILCSYGDIYSAMGKSAKARIYYKKALSLPGVSEKAIIEMNQKMAELEKSTSK